jgi:hypothetical protein
MGNFMVLLIFSLYLRNRRGYEVSVVGALTIIWVIPYG